ncbi:MAG: hypothetical protein ACK4TA_21315 [Saprospiraceae bacterium]
MRPLLLCLLLLNSLLVASYAQNAYYDAKTLYELDAYELDTLDLYKELLPLQADKDDWRNLRAFVIEPLRYAAEDRPKFNTQVVGKLKNLKQQYRIVLDKNGRPRFEKKLSSVYDLNDNLPQGPLTDVANSLVDIIFGSGLGANLNMRLIDATSSLLLNRSESELTLSFLSRLKEEFENRPFFIFSETEQTNGIQTDTFYLRQIFPSTHAIISDYDQVVSINIGKSLQNAFEEDLRNFYGNAQNFLVPLHLKDNIVYHTFSIVYASFTGLSRGEHPSVILQSLAERYNLAENALPRSALDTFKLSIQLLNGVSQNLLDVSPSRVWIKTDDFNKLSIREREYFIGLLYLNFRAIFQKLGITASRLQLGERAADFLQLQQLIYQNLAFLEQVENKIADLRLINATVTDRTPGVTQAQAITNISNTEQNRLHAFQEYAFMFSDIIQHISAYACWANRNSFLCSRAFQQDYLPIARDLLQVPLYIESKEYSTAFFKTLKVVEALHRSNPLYQTPPGLVRYLALAADVVAADSANKIKNILNEVTLPVGSYRVKRYSSNSIFVSALVGAGGGAEWLDNPAIEQKWAFQVSPFAPIGLDVNWGSRKLARNTAYETRGSSNGLFLSVVDFGAIISYRFQDNNSNNDLNTNNLPIIKLEQLLSPGLFYTHGFRNSPIVWGVGGQLTPRLRDIVDAKETRVDRANAFRFSTFLAIDLPLFTISVKNNRLPKYDTQIAQRQLDKMLLQRELDGLMRQMLRASSGEERRALQKEMDRKKKALKRK